MDLILEPQKGRPFVVEVGFFDTVLEIKHKIHKYHSIPVSKQTLIFDRRVLTDDRDVAQCGLLHNSRLRLLVAEPAARPPAKAIRLGVKVPAAAKTHVVWLEVDSDDATVASLKERLIRETELSVPPNRSAVLLWNGAELQDQRSLGECGLADGSEVEVILGPVVAGASAAAATGKKTMRVMVLTKCGTKKIPVEVSASDNVGELRKELQNLHQKLHFHLPPEGYFFIYKQNVMDDDRSFRWHQVGPGDTIEIFNGSVTGGS